MKIKPKTYYRKFAILPIQCRSCKCKIWFENYVIRLLPWYSEGFVYCMDCAKTLSDYPL